MKGMEWNKMVVRCCRQIREMQQARTVSRMNVVDSVEEREEGGWAGERAGWWMDGWWAREKKEGWGKRRGAQYLL